jgi:hypothetical protein
VEDLAADGVIYGEARWAPEQHLRAGLTAPAGAELPPRRRRRLRHRRAGERVSAFSIPGVLSATAAPERLLHHSCR